MSCHLHFHFTAPVQSVINSMFAVKNPETSTDRETFELGVNFDADGSTENVKIDAMGNSFGWQMHCSFFRWALKRSLMR